jgi:hypothetical protein
MSMRISPTDDFGCWGAMEQIWEDSHICSVAPGMPSRITQQCKEGGPVCADARFFIPVFAKYFEIPRRRQFAQLSHLVSYRLTAIVCRHARVQRCLHRYDAAMRCGERPLPKCAINGRFCPHDSWLSNLRNHWVSREAKNNPFLAHRLRHDCRSFIGDHGIPGKTEQKTA